MEAKRKVLMLPWLAYGHISPYIELAKKLSHQNFHIYFCSSPVNLQSIQVRLSESFSTSIELVELNLPSSLELPPHMHTTKGIPLHLIPTLIDAFESSSPNFSTILQTLNPDLLICDILQPRAIQLASSLNIPVIPFLVVGVATISHTVHQICTQNNVEYPFPEIEFRDPWLLKKFDLKVDSNDERGHGRFLQWVEDLKMCSNIILVNSFTEIDGKYIDYLSILLKKKVIPVGPLVDEISSLTNEESNDILDWLDKKDPKSTIYVSFGSEYYLSKHDREELAHGLELSGVNFIWVVRFPKGEGMRIEEALPNRFIERVGERGMIVDGWAPQLKILRHSSTSGFVCHCGWNSVVEAVLCGMPIIALPMQFDQPHHAKVVVAAGVGVEAERDDEGNIQREGIAKAIKQVVFEKTGEDLRRKVREISETLKSKEHQSQTIKGLVAELHKLYEI